MTPTQQALSSSFPQLTFSLNYPLAKKTYFRIGGPAEAYAETSNIEDVRSLVQFCHKHQTPITIIGSGSNVLVSDQGIQGLVLNLTNSSFEAEPINNQLRVTAGAGLKTALLVRQAVDAGGGGLEFFLGVPGTVGGAVYNNAHYLKHLISDFVTTVQVVTPTGQLLDLPAQECEFDYDSSRFHHSQEIIWQTTFLLPKSDKKVSHQLIAEATRYRAQTQPLGEPSSGCIFRNVPNTPQLSAQFPQFAGQSHISAGYLIEQAGLKGFRIGDIEVSTIHAAFMVNKAAGTAHQVQALIDHVQKTVYDQFGITLTPEIFYLR